MQHEILGYINAQEKDTKLLRKFYETFITYEQALQSIDIASRQVGSPPPLDLPRTAHHGVLALRDVLNDIEVQMEGDKWWLVVRGSHRQMPETIRIQLNVGGDIITEVVEQWKRKRERYNYA